MIFLCDLRELRAHQHRKAGAVGVSGPQGQGGVAQCDLSELALCFRGETQLRGREKRTAQSKRRAVLFRLKASFLGGKKGALV